MRILNFNNKIYTTEAVMESAEAFAEVATMKIKKSAKSLIVLISASDISDEEDIKDEFLNYVIGTIKIKSGRIKEQDE